MGSGSVSLCLPLGEASKSSPPGPSWPRPKGGRGKLTHYLNMRQVLVDERDRDRALADARGDALDRAAAHVAGHEHARHAGLQQERLAGDVSPPRTPAVRDR